VEIHNVELFLLLLFLSLCSNTDTEILLPESWSPERPKYRNLKVRRFGVPKFRNPEDQAPDFQATKDFCVCVFLCPVCIKAGKFPV